MSFLISQGKAKRKIKGAFWICGSKSDFEWLIDQIAKGMAAPVPNFSYGWLRIPRRTDFPPSGPAEPWEGEEAEP